MRGYREVVALGQSAATVAAGFCSASLYRDLALVLMFYPPSKLELGTVAHLRRSFWASAIGYLARAEDEYQRSLAADKGRSGASKRGLVAPGLSLRAVQDLLGDTQ